MDLKGIDKSIIAYFDKTPEGIHCPHFYQLKWANGCHYSCAWCYLQGTFRYPKYEKHGSHPNPIIKDRARVEGALRKFLDRAKENPKENYLLNSGELSDSLISTGDYLLLELIAEMDNWPDNVKVLILSKTDKGMGATFTMDKMLRLSIKDPDKTLDELGNAIKVLRKRIIMSWSINAHDVARRWEKGAPDPYSRMEMAESWHENGFPVRFRIDPIVPVDYWQHKYFKLIDDMFSLFDPDEIDRITLGTLRGLQSTINASQELSWTSYLDMDKSTPWGYKMPFDKRIEVYDEIMEYLVCEHGYEQSDHKLGICKETQEVRHAVSVSLTAKCNCQW